MKDWTPACAGVTSNKFLGNRIWELCRGPEGVRRHKVGALLHSLPPERVPTAVRENFRLNFARTLAENLLYLKETQQIHALLADKVEAMPLKGVLFASQFYPHIGCRPQSDIDVLVMENDLEKAHTLLLGAGWSEAVPRGFYKGHYHWVYQQGGAGPLLELHWRLKFPGTGSPNLEHLWDGARETEAEGMRFLQMRMEHLLEYMAANKAMQHYPALLDFVDIHQIVEKTPLRWGELLDNAGRNGTSGALWFGLVHCKELLGTTVPEDALRELVRRPSAFSARFLKRALNLRGGALWVPSPMLEGPAGRLYEAFLEGRPSAVWSLLSPLMFPSRERLQVLAGGSYPKYVWRNIRNALSFHPGRRTSARVEKRRVPMESAPG